jgi:hypothetical protein
VQELSRHQTGPENLAFVVASHRFQVEREEGMEEVIGQEGEQQETFDGIGVMAKDVIGMPLLGELVESVILRIRLSEKTHTEPSSACNAACNV